MHFRLPYLVITILLVNLWIVNSFAEDNVKKTEQPTLTPHQIFLASLKEGKVIAYFNQYWQTRNDVIANGYYRKIVNIISSNEFVVQDFFVDTNQKQSDPYIITNSFELNQAGVLRSIIGGYLAWYGNGQQQYQLNYDHGGLLDGEALSWYQNGQPKFKGFYKQGKKNVSWAEWYENGQIKSQVNYVANNLDGIAKQWHENGQLAIRGIYANGVLEGTWIACNSKGEKLSEGSYKANKRIGTWRYYVAGKKWAEGNYTNGLQNGVWAYWKQDGSKDREILYQNGQVVNNYGGGAKLLKGQ